MHRVRLAPIDAGELRRLSTAGSIGALMRSLASTPPAPADWDGADTTVAPNASIALQAALRDEAARTIQHNVFSNRSLRQRVDRVADALIQELRHGRPIDTAVGRLADVVPQLKLPIAWSPLLPFGGLLSGVRAQWQRVSLLIVAAHVLHEQLVLGQPQHDRQESVVQCNDVSVAAMGWRIEADGNYSTAPIG